MFGEFCVVKERQATGCETPKLWKGQLTMSILVRSINFSFWLTEPFSLSALNKTHSSSTFFVTPKLRNAINEFYAV